MTTTWRKQIEQEMKRHGESFRQFFHCTLEYEELDREFYNGYGGIEGEPFTLWTDNRVYFPVCYDGAEWCDSVPRNPNGQATEHCGGG
jgi:hypothetical protein